MNRINQQIKNHMTKKLKTNTELMTWIENKDYSVIYSVESKEQWTVATLLDQLEIRLDFIEHAFNNSGNISSRVQWLQLNERNLIELPPFNTSVVIGDNCQLLHKSGLKALLDMEANLSHMHRRDEFTIETHNGEVGVALFVPLSRLTNDQLSKDFIHNLPKIREQLEISEPNVGTKRTQQVGAIRSFINYRVIDYLDVFIWTIQKYKISELESINNHITLGEIASALNINLAKNNCEHIVSTTISTWKRDFYSKKLFTRDWFRSISINIKRDADLMSMRISTALSLEL